MVQVDAINLHLVRQPVPTYARQRNFYFHRYGQNGNKNYVYITKVDNCFMSEFSNHYTLCEFHGSITQ